MSKLLEIAMSQYGVNEIKGKNHNPIILNYFKEIGHDWVKDDETAWCSAFMNWCCLKAGVKSSGQLNARSWLDVGKEVIGPKTGDLVVYWRESLTSWKGHIGIYVNEDKDFIWTLGGNQHNSVCCSPYKKERVLSYRRV